MDNFFWNWEIMGFWAISLLSLLLAYIIKWTRALKVLNNHAEISVYFKVATSVAIVMGVFVLCGLIVMGLLHYELVGAFSDWKVYLLLMFVFDIVLIGSYWKKNQLQAVSNRLGTLCKFARWYKILRLFYAFSILLRVYVASSARTNVYHWTFPISDEYKAVETIVFSNLAFVVTKPYGFKGVTGIDIYLLKNKVFKKKLYSIEENEMEDIISWGTPEYPSYREYTYLSDDTAVLDLPITYIINLPLQNKYLLTGIDRTLKWYTPDNKRISVRDTLAIYY